MTLCVSALIASEFMPVSLLTPIASDLHLTEGQAGQAISVSGIFAVLTSLLVARATARIDRRIVLLAFTLLMIVSGAIVAIAPNFATLMAGCSQSCSCSWGSLRCSLICGPFSRP
jgi:predicted MFS family arabinose efflux permease